MTVARRACVRTAGGSLLERSEALCENRKRVFVRTADGSLFETADALS